MSTGAQFDHRVIRAHLIIYTKFRRYFQNKERYRGHIHAKLKKTVEYSWNIWGIRAALDRQGRYLLSDDLSLSSADLLFLNHINVKGPQNCQSFFDGYGPFSGFVQFMAIHQPIANRPFYLVSCQVSRYPLMFVLHKNVIIGAPFWNKKLHPHLDNFTGGECFRVGRFITTKRFD